MVKQLNLEMMEMANLDPSCKLLPSKSKIYSKAGMLVSSCEECTLSRGCNYFFKPVKAVGAWKHRSVKPYSPCLICGRKTKRRGRRFCSYKCARMYREGRARIGGKWVDRGALQSLYVEQRLSVKEIGKKFGVKSHSIHHHLQRLGISPPPVDEVTVSARAVTIPAWIRKALSIKSGDRMKALIVDGRIVFERWA